MLREQEGGKEVLRGIERYLEGRALRDDIEEEEDLPELEEVEEETGKDTKKDDANNVKTDQELPGFDALEEEQGGEQQLQTEEAAEKEKRSEEVSTYIFLSKYIERLEKGEMHL